MDIKIDAKAAFKQPSILKFFTNLETMSRENPFMKK